MIKHAEETLPSDLDCLHACTNPTINIILYTHTYMYVF